MKRFYFTFGVGQLLAGHVVVIDAETEAVARHIMRSQFGRCWSSCYTAHVYKRDIRPRYTELYPKTDVLADLRHTAKFEVNEKKGGDASMRIKKMIKAIKTALDEAVNMRDAVLDVISEYSPHIMHVKVDGAAFKDVQDTFLLAMIAIESMYDRVTLRADLTFTGNKEEVSYEIDISNEIGCNFYKIFVGFASKEFGYENLTIKEVQV